MKSKIEKDKEGRKKLEEKASRELSELDERLQYMSQTSQWAGSGCIAHGPQHTPQGKEGHAKGHRCVELKRWATCTVSVARASPPRARGCTPTYGPHCSLQFLSETPPQPHPNGKSASFRVPNVSAAPE